LDYLYVLTVADVRGTNPKLWNSWKASLFGDLYDLTQRALRRGLENPTDREQLIVEKKSQARDALLELGLSDKNIDSIWVLFDDSYFLRHRSEEVIWHTKWLSDSDTESEIGLIDVRLRTDGDGIEAVFYTPRSQRTFAHATAILDELGMNIVDARIVPIINGYSIDTYIFMELDKRMHIDASRLSKIRRSLTRILTAKDDDAVSVTRSMPRRARMFTTTASVEFAEDTANGRTVMELVAADRPGMLSKVGQAFIELGIDIDAAKIMTIGERAEDVFYVSDEAGIPLDATAKEQLRDNLVAKLDN